METRTDYLFVASMDVDPAFEDLFNEVYDNDHIPHLLRVPGVRSAKRMKGVPFRFAIAGGEKEMPAPTPVYSAIFEIDGPEVLSSPEWARAVEEGRWATEVRQHTTNRSHSVYRLT